jgi:hypothetical protein
LSVRDTRPDYRSGLATSSNLAATQQIPVPRRTAIRWHGCRRSPATFGLERQRRAGRWPRQSCPPPPEGRNSTPNGTGSPVLTPPRPRPITACSWPRSGAARRGDQTAPDGALEAGPRFVQRFRAEAETTFTRASTGTERQKARQNPNQSSRQGPVSPRHCGTNRVSSTSWAVSEVPRTAVPERVLAVCTGRAPLGWLPSSMSSQTTLGRRS